MSSRVLCLLIICLCSASGTNTSFSVNITNEGGFVKFKPLIFPGYGIAQLQFRFKTASSSAILLYQEDGRDKYMILKLKGGKIDLTIRGYKDCHTVMMNRAKETAYDDSRWHAVHMQLENLNSTNISLWIDDDLAATVGRNAKRDDVCKDFRLPGNNIETRENLFLYMAGSETFYNPAYAQINYLAKETR